MLLVNANLRESATKMGKVDNLKELAIRQGHLIDKDPDLENEAAIAFIKSQYVLKFNTGPIEGRDDLAEIIYLEKPHEELS